MEEFGEKQMYLGISLATTNYRQFRLFVDDLWPANYILRREELVEYIFEQQHKYCWFLFFNTAMVDPMFQFEPNHFLPKENRAYDRMKEIKIERLTRKRAINLITQEEYHNEIRTDRDLRVKCDWRKFEQE